MKITQLIRHLPWLLLLLVFSVHAETAAKIDFAVGGVTAQSLSGAVRTLAKGDLVESGDTVSTNEGRAQLRFTDGGFISLYSASVFRIDDYRWAGVSDGGERSFFTLLKGALRTVTGRVAKVNKKAYLMSSVVATIGVRGTEYSMQLQDASLTGAVAEGEIEVCNAGGCLAVPAGQAYFVANSGTKPVISQNQTFLPPTAPIGTDPLLTAGSKVGTVVDGVGNLLGTTSNALFDTLQGTTGELVGVTQDLAGALLGGTALSQSVQSIAGAAGGAVGGAVGAVGTTTGGVIGGTTGALGGIFGGTGGALLNLGF